MQIASDPLNDAFIMEAGRKNMFDELDGTEDTPGRVSGNISYVSGAKATGQYSEASGSNRKHLKTRGGYRLT